MRQPCRVAAVTLIVSVCVLAQAPTKTWANAAEFNLATAAFEEHDSNRRLAILEEWQTRYPHTDFESSRALTFAMTLRELGRINESFAHLVSLQQQEPDNASALLLLVTMAPSLTAPSAQEIAIVKNTAQRLQAIDMKLHLRPASPEGPIPPDTRRIIGFVRELRQESGKKHPDPNIRKNEAIAAALEWARKQER